MRVSIRRAAKITNQIKRSPIIFSSCLKVANLLIRAEAKVKTGKRLKMNKVLEKEKEEELAHHLKSHLYITGILMGQLCSKNSYRQRKKDTKSTKSSHNDRG